MRETPRDKERLEHILMACNNIAVGMQQYSFAEIQKNNLLYYGMIKNVEIIGEATYHLTKEFKEKHLDIPWRDMERMRHVLVHDYYVIDPKRLKAVLEEDIPFLCPQIQILYNTEFRG
ncbi:MAG: DUF86 domain-containing protein [Bacteroidales bacterium]|nr:DUF86 domain-containing protein [Bacteroidales bacterium]